MSPELEVLVANPAIWLSLFSLNGAAVGILWLMANKPGWGESVAVPVAFAMVGLVVGQLILRRDTSTKPEL